MEASEHYDLNSRLNSGLTACVTGGWRETGQETGSCQIAQEKLKKRAESQPSGARFVSWRLTLLIRSS